MNVDETLEQRGAIYGDYRTGVMARAEILGILNDIHMAEHNSNIPNVYNGMLFDVVNKLCRLAVSPTHIDSWHDVQGYAKLAEDHFKAQEAKNEE